MIGIVLKKHSDYMSFELLLQQHNYTYTIKFKRIFFVESTLEEFKLKDHPLIESCEKSGEMIVEPASVDRFDTNVTRLNLYGQSANGMKSWGPHRIIRRNNIFQHTTANNFDLTYRCTRTGLGCDIYMVDMGVSTYHQEVAGKMTLIGGTGLGGMTIGDTEFQSEPIYDVHGLHTTACAVGTTTGMAPDAEAFFVHVNGFGGADEQSFLDHCEIAYDHYMARAGTNRPAVINMSWAGLTVNISAVITAAYNDILADGMIVVIAANNNRWDLDVEQVIPAEGHADFVVVGATDARDGPMWLSRGTSAGTRGTGVGSAVDIYAPGTFLVVPEFGAAMDDYTTTQGTSFSAPYTAGVLACMLEGYQRLTNITQVRAVIQKLIDNSTKGALKFGSGYYGNSIINDRLLYLDPFVEIEPIDGLIPV